MRRGRLGAAWAAAPAWILAAAGAVQGQSVDALKAPGSPGFAILGVQPSAIERPTTPVAVGLSMYSATEKATVLPNSYALEFVPYWLTPRPRLSFAERSRPSPWRSIKQSFAVSVATDRASGEGDSTRLGIGFRAQILGGRPGLRADLMQDSLSRQLRAMDRVLEEVDSLDAGRDSVRIRLLRALADSLERDERRLRASFDSMSDPERRSGVRWEVAGAFATSFPSNRFEDGDVTAWGVWSTLSLRPTADASDVLLLVRFQELEVRRVVDGEPGTAAGTEGQKVLDVGVRALHGRGSVVASAELLGRTAFEVHEGSTPGTGLIRYDNSYRLAANVEYRLSDRAAVSWTFGRGFALAGADAGELISLIGLKWALGPGLDLPFPAG